MCQIAQEGHLSKKGEKPGKVAPRKLAVLWTGPLWGWKHRLSTEDCQGVKQGPSLLGLMVQLGDRKEASTSYLPVLFPKHMVGLCAQICSKGFK
jgi:hypothetical protein